jgi:hypothetical protein
VRHADREKMNRERRREGDWRGTEDKKIRRSGSIHIF